VSGLDLHLHMPLIPKYKLRVSLFPPCEPTYNLSFTCPHLSSEPGPFHRSATCIQSRDLKDGA
jgi:hypothetical protein